MAIPITGSQIARGLIEQDPPLVLARRRRAAQLLAEIDPRLHGGALLDRLAPARDVGKFVERLPERFGDQHPGPATPCRQSSSRRR